MHTQLRDIPARCLSPFGWSRVISELAASVMFRRRQLFQTDRQTDPLNGLFPGQPGQVGAREVKPVWILTKQEMMGWQWQQLDHRQIICTSLHRQTSQHLITIFTGRMLFLPPNQQCQNTEGRQTQFLAVSTHSIVSERSCPPRKRYGYDCVGQTGEYGR